MTRTSKHYGTLSGGLTYLRVGSGPPLVILPGLTLNHEALVGQARQTQARQLRPFTADREVWWINRKPGLTADTTMADLAEHYATALHDKFGTAVDVLGLSTGGTVALQLAVDHPETVRRLVVVASAYRLGSEGRLAQLRAAEALTEQRRDDAGAALLPMFTTNPALQGLLAQVGRVVGPGLFAQASPDLAITLFAEDDVDLRDRLGRITAPTLVIGGDKDPMYPVELFQETAELIPNGRLSLLPGKGHITVQAGPFLARDVLTFLNMDEPAQYRGDTGTEGENPPAEPDYRS
ncbi:MAG: alpha/beta fold hydrolase [Cryobacterium sp.]